MPKKREFKDCDKDVLEACKSKRNLLVRASCTNDKKHIIVNAYSNGEAVLREIYEGNEILAEAFPVEGRDLFVKVYEFNGYEIIFYTHKNFWHGDESRGRPAFDRSFFHYDCSLYENDGQKDSIAEFYTSVSTFLENHIPIVYERSRLLEEKDCQYSSGRNNVYLRMQLRQHDCGDFLISCIRKKVPERSEIFVGNDYGHAEFLFNRLSLPNEADLGSLIRL